MIALKSPQFYEMCVCKPFKIIKYIGKSSRFRAVEWRQDLLTAIATKASTWRRWNLLKWSHTQGAKFPKGQS
jgi:hypothetical protein